MNPHQTNNSETSISRSPSILSRDDAGAGDSYLDDDDDFIIDDDGAGYVPNAARKRAWDDSNGDSHSKRRATDFRVRFHEPFQSGSTPWKGGRRYLSILP